MQFARECVQRCCGDTAEITAGMRCGDAEMRRCGDVRRYAEMDGITAEMDGDGQNDAEMDWR